MDVEQYLLTREHAIRLGVFLAVFALVALWEIAAPRRQADASHLSERFTPERALHTEASASQPGERLTLP